MNHLSHSRRLPTDVTFFIGPVGAPEEIRSAYLRALEEKDAGNSAPLDEFIGLRLEALREIAEGGPNDTPPLKRLVEFLIDDEIVDYAASVGQGYMRGCPAQAITLYLDRMHCRNGKSLAEVLRKEDGEFIAAMLGQTSRAEWIYTSWAYPVSEDEPR